MDLIREGMRNVTEEGTAGYIFADFPIQVAGKTGTAENYSGQDHGWFVAYAPSTIRASSSPFSLNRRVRFQRVRADC